MRSVFAFGLLIALYASASGATVHHARMRHHVDAPPGVAAKFAAAPRRPPLYFNDTPRFDDPSKFGGQSLGMDP
ncbi:hypothetical protein JJB99_11920 [Bradyrhizobium diazoefficiens]|uniref:hypothetical protein n=1 Tax=Bradyrhizobium diazoefficiens TaxID=1355477 RepID=UPI00190BE4B6|nr:hypothetical protein [Bradyrhizobium diazoefficiens]QQO16801.1 hypothetical protein JJB99_11920 [Bradyrhizobium diazoefficiens]